jgi:hypothetical protein
MGRFGMRPCFFSNPFLFVFVSDEHHALLCLSSPAAALVRYTFELLINLIVYENFTITFISNINI